MVSGRRLPSPLSQSKRIREHSKAGDASLEETEEVLNKGEPIRNQEGALGSDLTELLDHGSVSRRLEIRKTRGGYLKSPVLGMVPVGQRPENPRQSAKGGRAGSSWAAPQPTVTPGQRSGRQKHNHPFLPLRFSVLWGFDGFRRPGCLGDTPLPVSGVGARAGGWPRDAPPDGTTHIYVYCTRTSTEYPEHIRHSLHVLSLMYFFLQE